MRPSHYYLEVGDERSAKALDAWRSVHDLFELKGWIERKLHQIWKLDSASKSETRLDFLHQNKHRQPTRPNSVRVSSLYFNKNVVANWWGLACGIAGLKFLLGR